jgi:hypothetical protein
MRRLLGLGFLLGMFACASSAEHAAHDQGSAASGSSGRANPGAANPLRGSLLTPGPDPNKLQGLAGGGSSTSTGGAPSCSDGMALHGNPGTVISQASVAMLFWGSYWSGTGTSDRAQYDGAWRVIAGDPAFYARLTEYSTAAQTIGTGSWAGSVVNDASLASGATITETQIQQEITAEISAGTAVPQIDGRIYVVMLPPGVTSQFDAQDGFAGHHSQFLAPGSTQPTRYAVITYNADAGYNDPVISHEISETITDPDLSTGWYDNFGEEIGDVCRFNYAPLDGYSIEEIFSIQTCSCVGAGQVTVADAGVSDASVVTTGCTAAAWTASGVYTAGTTASYKGSQYTAAYWNQNAEPDLNSGAAGSGQPWSLPTACTTQTCTPACSGKACGDDGCGGTCGTCGPTQACNASNQCVASCLPSCDLKQCGSDGCGGTCGTCASGLTCNPGNQCVAPCVPACSGKQCGGDTCGGSCGTCASGETCDSDGTCQGSPTVGCGRLSPWDPNKPWYDYSVGEVAVGSNDHEYTCKNVAYCIDDPTSTIGATYGWTDDGPCE